MSMTMCKLKARPNTTHIKFLIRIGDFDSQLAEIPNQTYITDKATKPELQAVASGSPKAAGPAAFTSIAIKGCYRQHSGWQKIHHELQKMAIGNCWNVDKVDGGGVYQASETTK